jgi:hypothetical protein
MLMLFRLYALVFRAWFVVRQPFGHVISWFFPDLLIKRRVDLAWPPSQLRQGGIDDNGGQPGRHFRLPLELVQMPASGEECILDRILSVGSITQVSMSSSVKSRHAPGNNILELLGIIFNDAYVKALLVSDIRLCLLHGVYASWSHCKKHAACQTITG